MAVQRSTEDIPAVTANTLGPACSLCERDMQKTWIAYRLVECPNCKKLCHSKDLSSIVSKPVTQISNFRGRGPTQPENGENATGPVNSQDPNISDNRQDYSQNLHNSTRNTLNNSNRGRRNNRSLNRMSQMLENTVQRVLMNMNISPVQPPMNKTK
ncbi:hypothetical protein FF38_01898 [Lucilia cuprina]|uniref:Uncharacterized protein n=1 Tax=Lucilia cuprina TaxID=7375 RepID=A0A0L0BSB8_LUCCU|nr:hypothetical protein FF38_01898 [Lucilia cuprina]